MNQYLFVIEGDGFTDTYSAICAEEDLQGIKEACCMESEEKHGTRSGCTGVIMVTNDRKDN